MAPTFYFDFVTENLNYILVVYFVTFFSNKIKYMICDEKIKNKIKSLKIVK
jgi:hypothetical protein